MNRQELLCGGRTITGKDRLTRTVQMTGHHGEWHHENSMGHGSIFSLNSNARVQQPAIASPVLNKRQLLPMLNMLAIAGVQDSSYWIRVNEWSTQKRWQTVSGYEAPLLPDRRRPPHIRCSETRTLRPARNSPAPWQHRQQLLHDREAAIPRPGPPGSGCFS